MYVWVRVVSKCSGIGEHLRSPDCQACVRALFRVTRSALAAACGSSIERPLVPARHDVAGRLVCEGPSRGQVSWRPSTEETVTLKRRAHSCSCLEKECIFLFLS